jgi:GTPase SAR1 family protein
MSDARGAAGPPPGPPRGGGGRGPLCVLMIGMAGSGKTSLVQRLNAELRAAGREPYLVNLDPAVMHLPFGPHVDIRDTVNYKEVMRQYGLGPNGAIVTSLNLFATRFDQVATIIQKRVDEAAAAEAAVAEAPAAPTGPLASAASSAATAAAAPAASTAPTAPAASAAPTAPAASAAEASPAAGEAPAAAEAAAAEAAAAASAAATAAAAPAESAAAGSARSASGATTRHFLVDTPGQIEVFTWSASGQLITDMLAATLPTVVVFVVDTVRARSPTTFMSNMLYACSILYKTRLPLVVAFNKVDAVAHDLALAWMADFDAFQTALEAEGRRSDSYMNSLTRSLALALDEFYSGLHAVGVSAATGQGVPDLLRALDAAAADFGETAGAERQATAAALLEASAARERRELGKLREDRRAAGDGAAAAGGGGQAGAR